MEGIRLHKIYKTKQDFSENLEQKSVNLEIFTTGKRISSQPRQYDWFFFWPKPSRAPETPLQLSASFEENRMERKKVEMV